LLPRVSPPPSGDLAERPEVVVPCEAKAAASQDRDPAVVRDTEREIQARITSAIFRAIHVINEQLPREKRLGSAFDTVLWGSDAGLDSLGLVNLIVAVEESIAEEFGTSISLLNHTFALEPEISFLTVGSLRDYVVSLVEEMSTNSRG
jgi:acyl carrier protein